MRAPVTFEPISMTSKSGVGILSTVAVVLELRIAEHTAMQLLHHSLVLQIAGSIGCNTVCTDRCPQQRQVQQQLVVTQRFDPRIEQHTAEQFLQDILEQSVVAHIAQSYLEIDHSQQQQH